MADDPNKKKHDGKLVSTQPHEVRYIADKKNLPPPLVKTIIEQVGPSRQKVERKLDDMKRNRGK
jgi:hypothetical protein